MNFVDLALVLGLAVSTGCAALRPAPAAPSQTEDEGDEDEDSGVDGLLETVRRFNEALAAQKFDVATGLLRRAERGIRNASELTRSHPEFEDVESVVERASVRLADAVERDREMRRQQAIAELTRRAEKVLSRAASLYDELKQRPATADDVQLLAQIRSELGDIQAEGVPYGDDPNYRAHASDRDQKASVIAQLEKRSAWGVGVSKRLSEIVARGLAAEQRGASTAELPARAEAYRHAVDAFVGCINLLADLEREPAYDAGLPIDIPGGTVALGALKPQCLKRSADDRVRADRLTWQFEVDQRLATLRSAVSAVQNAQNAEAALSATQAAIEAMRGCDSELGALVRHPGADATVGLETPFGPLPLARVAQQCRSEQTRLGKQIPTLQWQVALQAVVEPLTEIGTAVSRASAATTGAARLESWLQALAKIRVCIAEAKRLASAPGADSRHRMASPAGELTIAQIESFCEKQRAFGEAEEKKARADATVEAFVESCRGDERTVVRREGIPTRIEAVAGGRAFYYESGAGKDASIRRFGFDATGAQVDFWRRWQNQVGALVQELARVMAPVRAAASGTDLLKAVEASTPVLQVCQELLAGSRENPGYDPSVTFDSPFGKLRAPNLVAACKAEQQRLARSLDATRWQAKLEGLIARIDGASAQLTEAKAAKASKDKLALAGQAVGSFKECNERAPALAKEGGAQPKLKRKSSHGELNLAGLVRVCAQQEKAANAALEDALAAQTLEQFIATCRGDEAAVAGREGMPTRVEAVGAGRVFVYVAAKRGRKAPVTTRFAFDESGRRTTEKQLRAQASPAKAPAR